MFIDFFNMLFPNVCCICGEHLVTDEMLLCTTCDSSLPRTSYWKHQINPIQQTMESRIGVSHASSYLFFQKKNSVQKLLHLIKYKGDRALAELIGSYFGKELSSVPALNDVSIIVPVPLHPRKKLQRGFNQSAEIAKGIAKSLNIPCETGILYRNTNSVTQTGKHREERWDNVKQVFAVRSEVSLKDKHVLVVDDVFTTGATLESCCVALKRAKPKSISVVTLAFADY
jgi:competence protein ComFC